MPNGYKSVLKDNIGGLTLDSLEITHPATKDIFVKGDSIDLSGLVVTGTLGNMQGDVTSDCIVSPSVFNIEGPQTVTLSYGGLSVNYDVIVGAGSYFIIATREPSLKDKTVSITDGTRTWQSKFNNEGIAEIRDVSSVGDLTITSTDGTNIAETIYTIENYDTYNIRLNFYTIYGFFF